jgi:uncharacterized protein (TIGR02147 family)
MDYVRKLEEQFNFRKAHNPIYSLRAYARDLDLHPSTLSKILKGTRRLPFAVVESVVTRLELSQTEKEHFFTSVLQSRGLRALQQTPWPNPPVKTLKNDIHFSIISEWEHYAILNLLKLKDFQSSYQWMSDRIGISIFRCKKVIETLLQAELIKQDDQKNFIRNYPKITSSDEVSAHALKIAHQNDLKLAASKIWNTPLSQRDFYSMTMPINVKNLKRAKLLTRSYVKEMEALLETGELTEVYQLAVQLFPLSTTFRRKLRGF